MLSLAGSNKVPQSCVTKNVIVIGHPLGLRRPAKILWYIGSIQSANVSSKVSKTKCGISSGLRPSGAVVFIHKQSGNLHVVLQDQIVNQKICKRIRLVYCS